MRAFDRSLHGRRGLALAFAFVSVTMACEPCFVHTKTTFGVRPAEADDSCEVVCRRVIDRPRMHQVVECRRGVEGGKPVVQCVFSSPCPVNDFRL